MRKHHPCRMTVASCRCRQGGLQPLFTFFFTATISVLKKTRHYPATGFFHPSTFVRLPTLNGAAAEHWQVLCRLIALVVMLTLRAVSPPAGRSDVRQIATDIIVGRFLLYCFADEPACGRDRFELASACCLPPARDFCFRSNTCHLLLSLLS